MEYNILVTKRLNTMKLVREGHFDPEIIGATFSLSRLITEMEKLEIGAQQDIEQAERDPPSDQFGTVFALGTGPLEHQRLHAKYTYVHGIALLRAMQTKFGDRVSLQNREVRQMFRSLEDRLRQGGLAAREIRLIMIHFCDAIAEAQSLAFLESQPREIVDRLIRSTRRSIERGQFTTLGTALPEEVEALHQEATEALQAKGYENRDITPFSLEELAFLETEAIPEIRHRIFMRLKM